MNNNSYRIATEIMLKMDEAIEKKDRETFRICLEDSRMNNCIVGNNILTEKYCQLCIKALNVFI